MQIEIPIASTLRATPNLGCLNVKLNLRFGPITLTPARFDAASKEPAGSWAERLIPVYEDNINEQLKT
jgi:hypothetical protein